MNGAVPSAESAQEPVDSAIGQWVKKKILEHLRPDRDNLRSGSNALRELSARRGRGNHHIALAVARMEERTNLSHGVCARLSLRIEILQ